MEINGEGCVWDEVAGKTNCGLLGGMGVNNFDNYYRGDAAGTSWENWNFEDMRGDNADKNYYGNDGWAQDGSSADNSANWDSNPWANPSVSNGYYDPLSGWPNSGEIGTNYYGQNFEPGYYNVNPNWGPSNYYATSKRRRR